MTHASQAYHERPDAFAVQFLQYNNLGLRSLALASRVLDADLASDCVCTVRRSVEKCRRERLNGELGESVWVQ